MKIAGFQGDVVKLVTSSGSAVATYEYDAWGNILSKSGTMADKNPLRYRGYYYDSETGFYYLQSRYYDPANRRFVNADCYESTGQGFIGTNMFAYCNNAPTASHDSDGECTRFLLWKIDCGKAACEESSNYNPAAERVAVIYDSRTSGYFGGLIGGKGFARQASGWVCELEDEYIVDEFPFTDMDGFVDSWNSMDGEYSAAFIIMHGYPGGLSCSGKNLTNAPNGDYSFFDLNPIPITTVYLFSCHGATFSERNEPVASNLAYLTGGNVWAIYGGTVKYAIYGYMPYSQNGSWSRTKGRNTLTY